MEVVPGIEVGGMEELFVGLLFGAGIFVFVGANMVYIGVLLRGNLVAVEGVELALWQVRTM